MISIIPTIAVLTPDDPAAAPGLPRVPFPVWPEGAPGAMGCEAQDVPRLTPYFAEPAGATGAAMVICPGGGYVSLAPHEGRDYACWLNEQGITAFVLQYRLGNDGYRHPAMLQDAARAIRWVRSRAREWGLDPRRVGIMGSSAGGHLAATLLTHFDAGDPSAADPVERESSRPDLGVLCYPVITMGEQGHAGCRRSLLGDAPSPELVRLLSNELQVTSETPPTFLFHTVEDSGVPVQNSLLFATALAAHGVPFALHVYPRGAHGMGLGTRERDPAARHPWTTQGALWLQEQGFVR
jgi:acetyl esterase/lipase